jgi:hypothetical protein
MYNFDTGYATWPLVANNTVARRAQSGWNMKKNERAKRESNVQLGDFQKSKPRTVADPEAFPEDEGEARLYTKRGRLTISGEMLGHLQIKDHNFFEVFFDLKNERIALKFFKERTPDSYKTSNPKTSKAFELKGPCFREGLEIKKQLKPVIIKLKKNLKEGFIFFSYSDFATPIKKGSKQG